MQLLDSSGTTVLDSTISDELGRYSFSVAASTDVVVRVRAETITGDWNVQVRNNVDTSASPPPLDQRPIWVMDLEISSGAVDDTDVDLTATTGWDGNSYAGTRVAAPFAVLDTVYQVMQFVRSEVPGTTFPPLDVFWSPQNTPDVGAQNLDTGALGTSFYTQNQIFLLGMEGADAEEFDSLVIAHEWGHYFEDNFSRSDSIGGSHGLGDILDKRVAFGEGFATALAGIMLDNPQYCDTLWTSGGNLSGFEIDIDNEFVGTAGWFNELSVMRIIYDLWDTNDLGDGNDTGSIGFAPIWDVMTGPQVSTEAFTSIFTFATFLKQQGTGENALIDSLLAEQNINGPGIDEFGTNESNDGPGTPDDVFPLYTTLMMGMTEQICVNSSFDDGNRDGNKLAEYRYLLLDVPANGRVTLSMQTVSADGDTNLPAPADPNYDCVAAFDSGDPQVHEYSDPDFTFMLGRNVFVPGWSCEPNSETPSRTGTLSAGKYRIDLNEFRHADPQSPVDYAERVCFDFLAN